jgi:outer membrane beta-barrel protein
MACLTLFAGFVFLPPSSTLAQDNQEKFEDYEIRVIRPKYFQKSGRFELGAQFNAVMNETFIYTFLATGLMTYHFNEILAIEGAASYGFSINKEDKRILFDEYRVRTQIFRTTYMLEAALQWTPIYGKWQLPSGRLVYFDTFLAGGGGLTGVEWKYSDFCSTPAAGTYDLPADTLKSYPTFLIGGGQRFYVRRDVAVKWDIRSHWVMYDKLDAECNPEAASSSSDLHTNITMQLGASKFF